MPDIWRMLDLSTGHVSFETSEWIERNIENPNCDLTIYNKSEYGWWMRVPDEMDDSDELDIPSDLRVVLEYARHHGCLWVMFDRDAETISRLPEFYW